ncbi:uncharacterized protein LOC128314942 [Acinonyx jubatus]|uniref:Uncharacterized protein LOC128314942 n=1 Tax=Acinonyx jubatus TaxID=32536 RepID=A0ABM3PVQ3_ACIJB|nr:uncharacterized protein LOC128314942 [Acinonyx jubatus]
MCSILCVYPCVLGYCVSRCSHDCTWWVGRYVGSLCIPVCLCILCVFCGHPFEVSLCMCPFGILCACPWAPLYLYFSSEQSCPVEAMCLYFACVCVLPGPICVAQFLWTSSCGRCPGVPACPDIPSCGYVCLETPCTPFPVFVVRVPLCACAPRAPLRSTCVWVPACARSRPRVPRAGPGSCVLTPHGYPACVPVRLAGGLGAHTVAAGPTARQGAGRREGAAAAAGSAGTSPRQTGGRAGGGGRGFEPAPEPRGPLPRPAAWGGPPPPSPGAAEMQFPVQAPRLRGLFRAGLERRGATRPRPKTRSWSRQVLLAELLS